MVKPTCSRHSSGSLAGLFRLGQLLASLGDQVVGAAGQDQLLRVVEDQLVEQVDVGRLAVQEEPEPADVKGTDAVLATLVAQHQTQHRKGVVAVYRLGCVERRPFQTRLLNDKRPERHRVVGAEPARLALDRLRFQLGPRLDVIPAGVVGLLGRGHPQLDDAHGGDGSEVVRVEDADQRFGDLGELVVELQPGPRRQEGEGLDEAFDVGVRRGATVRTDAKPVGDPGIGRGEFAAHLLDECQLLPVIAKEFRCHPSALPISTSPVVGCTVESNTTSSWIGSTLKVALMRK
jgi:hypothetical protein